ncbi:MAG TPA: SIS domain-containing protein [Spirochaetes bacterium]|nr:SIS domain-containing protein [Spirochaetota bacterium]
MKERHKIILDEFYQNAKGVFDRIGDNTLQDIVSLILDAEQIYVLGIGHSGMFGRILSMKLNHVGLKAFTIFDEINPPFTKNDLLIAISQSGGTATVVTLAEKAKKLGGRVLGVTSNENSALGRISDELLKIDRHADDVSFEGLAPIGDKKNQNLLGVLFGFNIYILFYTLVIELAKKREETPDSINVRHANLQ